MKAMTKDQLVEAVFKKAGCCSKKEAAEGVNAFLEVVSETLSKGQDVALTGFGTFRVSKRKARMGRNPRTGKSIKISARKVPAFKAGKGLKDAVR